MRRETIKEAIRIFGADFLDDETEENIRIIKTCACGCMMDETETLEGICIKDLLDD